MLGKKANWLVFEAGEPNGKMRWDEGIELGQGAVEHEQGAADEQQDLLVLQQDTAE